MVSPFPAQWTPDHAAAVEPRAGSPAHIPKLGAAELNHGKVGGTIGKGRRSGSSIRQTGLSVLWA